MGTFVILIAILFLIVGMIGHCWLLVEAYQDDTSTGWLCLVLFPYALYYLLTQVDPPKKWWILGLWAVGEIPGAILFQIAQQY